MHNLTLTALVAAVIAAGSATAPAGELDYYKGAVYPGASFRKDVERPTLKTRKAPPRRVCATRSD